MPGYEVLGDEEFNEVQKVFGAGGVLFRHGFENLRNGHFAVRAFEDAFAQKFQVTNALAVSSGTAALRVALAALGIGRGDSVLIPSFTFVATAEAVIESGATPVAVEIDSTLNMDPEDLERSWRSNTRAVIAVHMLGVPADLRRIMAICDARGAALIEDTAWGCGALLDDRPLGTWGRIGTYSFDYAKTLTTGEGGMLVFQIKDDFKRAAAWHDHGHENNPTLARWEDSRSGSGFNFRMTELQGAVGLAQLRKLDLIVERQREYHGKIRDAISKIPHIRWRDEPIGSSPSGDAAIFFTQSRTQAIQCRSALLRAGVSTKILPEAVTWHFAKTWTHMPELESGTGENLESAFPQSQEFLSRAVALPVSIGTNPPQAQVIADVICETMTRYQ